MISSFLISGGRRIIRRYAKNFTRSLTTIGDGYPLAFRAPPPQPSHALLPLQIPPLEARPSFGKAHFYSTRTPEDPTAPLLEKTARFLAIPVGSMDPKDLHQAAELVKSWVNVASEPTAESVDHCFQILDRSVHDMERKGNEYMLNTFQQLLLLTIEHWKTAWENGQANPWFAKQVQIKLVKWSRATEGLFQADISIHNTILESYRKVQRQEDPHKAAYHVQQQVDNLIQTNIRVQRPKHQTSEIMLPQPNHQTYLILLEAWLDVGEVEKALPILSALLELPSPQEPLSPILLENVLQLCAQQGAGEWAEEVLSFMHEFYGTGLITEKPNNSHYNQLMLAWANAKDPEQSEQKTKEILSFLETEGKTNPDLQPNSDTYHAILRTHSQLGQMEQAETLLMQLCEDYQKDTDSVIRPEAQWFPTVLEGWAQLETPDAGIKAETLLKQLWKFHYNKETEHLLPNGACYTAVMQAYASSGHPKAGQHADRLFSGLLVQSQRHDNIQPTLETYNTLMQAHAACGEIERADKVLQVMVKEHPTNAQIPEPTIDCFHTLLQAHANSPAVLAGQKARDLLDQMWQFDAAGTLTNVRPNQETYRICIKAWAISGHVDAGEESDRLLEELLEKAAEFQEEDPSFQPSTDTYNSVLKAWAQIGDYGQAKKVFGKIPTTARNVDTYNLLLSALERSDVVQGEIADSILTAMILRDVPPSQTTHELAHRCWSQSTTDKAHYRMRVLEQKLESSVEQSQ